MQHDKLPSGGQWHEWVWKEILKPSQKPHLHLQWIYIYRERDFFFFKQQMECFQIKTSRAHMKCLESGRPLLDEPSVCQIPCRPIRFLLYQRSRLAGCFCCFAFLLMRKCWASYLCNAKKKKTQEVTVQNKVEQTSSLSLHITSL